MLRAGALLVSLLLAGCSWSDVLVQETKSVPADASFGYFQGYESGCKTGIAERGGIGFDKPARARDEERAKKEQDYRKGWEDGMRNCAERYAGFVLFRRGLD